MSYPESVRYLYALGNELKPGAKFGLETMQALLEALGHPERGQRFVHVAGTNGKGSTAAALASMLQEAGMATGLYTSPHLIEPTERIRVNGKDVSAAEFADVFEQVHAAAGAFETHPSYFETVTAMALLVFGEKTEISVMEVGLGGRLDATNVITPELCVIAPVSYDHEAYLGSSLRSIAAEKAGILKPGVPAIVNRQRPEAKAVIESKAAESGCEILRVADARLELIESSARASTFLLDGRKYACPLPGRHQVENAAAAILACRRLRVDESAIERGLRKMQWPGRLEFISNAPDFILDGAHNPAGAAALAQYIEEFYRDRPVWIVYGAMRDKANEEVTELLFPLAKRLILTAPDFPRALRPEAIAEITAHGNAVLTGDVEQAIREARTAPKEAGVFFTGSLYLVGEARQRLLGARVPVS